METVLSLESFKTEYVRNTLRNILIKVSAEQHAVVVTSNFTNNDYWTNELLSNMLKVIYLKVYPCY